MNSCFVHLLIISCARAIFNQIVPHEHEINMEMNDQVRLHGYPLLTYTVTTADGYKLGVHRIPGPRGEEIIDGLKNAKAQRREPVLLMHGIGAASHGLVVAGPGKVVDGQVMGKAIPYQLADTGKYDVWMMNARGNYFSRDHLWLNPDTQPEFWDFGLEELAEQDLKAVVSFVQEERDDDQKITYLAHSQGSSIGFWAFNVEPEFYEAHIKLFVAICPAVFFEHSRETQLQELAEQESAQSVIFGLDFVEVGGKDRDKRDELIQYIINNHLYICVANPGACRTDFDYNSAKEMDKSPSVDARRWDPERVPFLEQAKGGTSLKNIAHMGQLMKYHRFARYNYGYAQGYPIPLDKSSIPTAIFVARHDQLADVKDNHHLC